MTVRPLWLSSEIQALFPSMIHDFVTPITGVSIDTRSLKKGDLFVAIQGDHIDGHLFVQDAFQKGAAAACVREDYASDLPQNFLIRHPDPLQALEDIARAARQRSQSTMIGVTGSAGKTSVKDALNAVLSLQGPTYASLRSYNNHYGVPLCLSQVSMDIRWAIMEMGMNHAGEIRHLTSIVRPHVAIITTIAPAHLAFFASEEGIADAKAEIFCGMEPGGYVFLPRDNPHYQRLKHHALNAQLIIIDFGQHPEAACHVAQYNVISGVAHIKACILGHTVHYTLPSLGLHRALNSVAVLGCVHVVGGSLDQACATLAEVDPSPGRGAKHLVSYHDQKILVLDESYNANPASMAEALKAFCAYDPLVPEGRRIAILGDMLELGPSSEKLHQDLAPLIASLPIHHVITCGTLMRHLHHALSSEKRSMHGAQSSDLLPHLPDLLQNGDTVMIKGSWGSGMRTVLQDLLSEH